MTGPPFPRWRVPLSTIALLVFTTALLAITAAAAVAQI